MKRLQLISSLTVNTMLMPWCIAKMEAIGCARGFTDILNLTKKTHLGAVEKDNKVVFITMAVFWGF